MALPEVYSGKAEHGRNRAVVQGRREQVVRSQYNLALAEKAQHSHADVSRGAAKQARREVICL
jgi:hypothetical protein